MKTVGLYEVTFLDYDDTFQEIGSFRLVKLNEPDEDDLSRVALEISLWSGDVVVVECDRVDVVEGRFRSTNDLSLSWVAEIFFGDGGWMRYRGESREFLPMIRRFIRTGKMPMGLYVEDGGRGQPDRGSTLIVPPFLRPITQ